MEDVVDMENELSDRLEDFAQRLEDAASKYFLENCLVVFKNCFYF